MAKRRMIDLNKLRKSNGYVLAIVNTQTGEYEPVTKDVALITRCKDCKSRSKVPCKDIFGENLYRCYFHECVVMDKDFCSFAERKEE